VPNIVKFDAFDAKFDAKMCFTTAQLCKATLDNTILFGTQKNVA